MYGIYLCLSDLLQLVWESLLHPGCQAYPQNRNRLRHGKQTCGFQGGGGREWDVVRVWFNRCKLLHLEWIVHEVLLYSIENYIKALVTEDGR